MQYLAPSYHAKAAEHTMNGVRGHKNRKSTFFLLWMSIETNEEITRKTYCKGTWVVPELNPYF